jgi:chorismate--pyruvate lyase
LDNRGRQKLAVRVIPIVTSVFSKAVQVPEWFAAESLPATVADPPVLKFWLAYRGLLTAQLREHFGKPYSLRVVAQRRGMPDKSEAAALKCVPQEMLIREIELLIDDRPVVFAQTWVPDATMRGNPWLGTLGGNALGERLAGVASLERGEFVCASLRPGEVLWDSSLRDAQAAPRTLWARRSWFSLGGPRILVTEVFLPEFVQCIRGS